jgi:DNA-binding SARP family transcriptional activator
VDVEAFEEAATTARHARASAAYRAAIDLYSGELLPQDRYEAWAEERRAQLRGLYLSLLLEMAGFYEERKEFGEAATAEQLDGYESVRLFVERARQRDPSFVVTPRNGQAVATPRLRRKPTPTPRMRTRTLR